MKTQFHKVIRDISTDYSKNFMLVLAIAIGVFGVGTILGAYSVLNREMASNYLGTNPASATIEVASGISSELLDSVKSFPGIKDAERHATISSRMKVGDKWYPLLLFVVDDFENKKTNKINPQSGDITPALGEMVVERTALVVMQADIGNEITIKTPHGQPRWIRITGTVHDPGLAPAWQEESGYGYITLKTLEILGETQGFDQLRIVVSENPKASVSIIKKSEELSSWLESKGHTVHEIQVPPPNKHPHQSQMNAVLSIFTIFSFMTLILGSILVATSLATLMLKQVRQIGVMKTIGARSSQITGLYLMMILILCFVALAIAIPLSGFAASAFYDKIAVLLNLEIVNRSIPGWVLMVQAGSGIIIPIVAAAFPVIKGSRISVRTALDNYGVDLKNQGKDQTSRLVAGLSFLNESVKLSFRNVFRQRSRLAMTLGLLAAGGAMFMTAINVSDAWEDNLNMIYSQRLYDLEVKLNERVETESILGKLKDIDGVTEAEAWDFSATSFVRENSREITHTYPDKGHGSFTLLALPVATKLIQPKVFDGRWLTSEIQSGVVLNQGARSMSRGTKLNDEITLSVEGKASTWKVIGFTEDVGSGAAAYVSVDAFAKQNNSSGTAKMFRIAYADRSKENAVAKNKDIEDLLERENISVSGTIPVWLLHNAMAAHMKVLVNSLLAMAILMALVGTLGLTSAMSMNVMERTREIGVMRAIGATPMTIKNIVVWEGMVIGAISVVLAFVLSLLLSYLLGRFIGAMAFKTPLSLTISLLGFGGWIAIILAGSYAATFFPAQRANRKTIREALIYE